MTLRSRIGLATRGFRGGSGDGAGLNIYINEELLLDEGSLPTIALEESIDLSIELVEVNVSTVEILTDIEVSASLELEGTV